MMYLMISCAFLALASAQDEAHAMRHSFKGPFEPGVQIPFWRAGAGAYVDAEYVRITPAKQSRTGFMWNLVPSTMVDWQVEFDFKCTGHKNFGGDGFAFWYAEQKALLGGVFGSTDYWNGLGIFFDTYNNDGVGAAGTILAIDNDGTQTYNPDDDGAAMALGSCDIVMRNTDEPMTARIKYQGGQLVVSTKKPDKTEFKECFTLDKIELGVDKFFGLSAHTGDVADNHDIHNFIVTDLSPTGVDLAEVRTRYRQKIETQHQLPKHEEMEPREFQHSVLTMLHQSQEALNLIEVSQIAIGDYLHNSLDSPTPSASDAVTDSDTPKPPKPPPSSSRASDAQNQRAQDSMSKTLQDIQKTLNGLKSQVQRISSADSEPVEAGGESWLSFLMILAILVVSIYHCHLTLKDQHRRYSKLP